MKLRVPVVTVFGGDTAPSSKLDRRDSLRQCHVRAVKVRELKGGQESQEN